MLTSIQSSQLIIDFNYGNALEDALRAAHVPFDLVMHPIDRRDLGAAVLWWPHQSSEPVIEEPNKLDIDLDRTTVVYKLRGAVDRFSARWDSFIVTEQDYVDYLSLHSIMPPLFVPRLRESSLLFVGYELNTWYFRVLVSSFARLLSSRRRDIMQGWAVLQHVTPLEQQLWDSFGIKAYSIAPEHFAKVLMDMRLKVRSTEGR
jgi:hypothetical protein